MNKAQKLINLIEETPQYYVDYHHGNGTFGDYHKARLYRDKWAAEQHAKQYGGKVEPDPSGKFLVVKEKDNRNK
jgi:hypothetical protein